MRDFKGMKRQRGRNRNTGNKPQQHNANRAYDSNGPEGKVRGTAQSIFEKYQQLARDATTGGDRVLAENFLQHAEHYFRLIRAIQPNRPVTDIIGRDQYSSGMDIDFEAEPEETPEVPAAAENEQPSEGGEGEDRPRFENRQQNRDRFEGNRQNREDRPRDDRPRDDREGGRRDRWRDRDDRPRDGQRDDRPKDGQRDDRPRDRDDRPRDGQRDDRPRDRDDRPRDDRPREDRFRDRDDRPRDEDRPRDREDRPREEREGGRRNRYDRDRNRDEPRDPLAVIEPQAAPLAAEPAAPSPRLRGQDGAVSELPGFLSRSAPAATEEPAEAPAKPKRRARAPKSFEAEAAKGSDEN